MESVQKFDPARAGEYEQQSRIALAGYEACHELSACLLTATLGSGTKARVLVVGAGGTAQEIVTAAKMEPLWQFTAVDPSRPMLDLAMTKLEEQGLASRTKVHLGTVEDLPPGEPFDAATLIGVLHHLPGDEAKGTILSSIAARLKPGAPLILACNHLAYASQPLLLEAWGQRWRMNGASPEEVESKLAKILQGADPPHSEKAVALLLENAGFEPPLRFFSSLFWGACSGEPGCRAARQLKRGHQDDCQRPSASLRAGMDGGVERPQRGTGSVALHRGFRDEQHATVRRVRGGKEVAPVHRAFGATRAASMGQNASRYDHAR